MSTLLQRTLSGAVYVAVIVGTILAPQSFYFVFIACLMAVLGIREFMHMTGKDTWLTWMSGVTSTCLIVWMWIASYYSVEAIKRTEDFESTEWLLLGCFIILIVVLMMLLFVALIGELFRGGTDPVKNWGRYLQSVAMIGLPFGCMAAMSAARPMYLLALFISIWVNDMGAYLVGMATSHLPGGNHKMFVRVSPKKSWEGLIGGVLFNLAAGYVFYRAGWISPLWYSLVFVMAASVFGTLGDLVESLLKRSVGVKDSGRFMPGHGGVLDRFDSMLLAAPCVGLIMMIVRIIEHL